MISLLDLPEEILEIVVFLIIAPELPNGSSAKLEALLPVLTIHPVLYRIGIPLLYHTISISNSAKAYLLCRTFDAAPHYAKHVRTLHATALYPSLPFILRRIARADAHIDVLSLALDAPPSSHSATYAQKHTSELEEWSFNPRNPDIAVARAVASVLPQIQPGPRDFAISRNRPPLPRDRERLQLLDAAIAETLPVWDGLRSIIIAFRLPRDSAIPSGLARAPNLQRIRTPLPTVWHEALLIASENSSLKRLAVTVTHVKSRARAGLVFVPVPGHDKDARPSSSQASIPTKDLSSLVSPSGTDAITKGSARPSLADRLRAPVEVVSPFGTFHDRTERVLETEERPLGRQQVLQDGQGGISAWLLEARQHPRLLQLMLAESDAQENRQRSEMEMVGQHVSRDRKVNSRFQNTIRCSPRDATCSTRLQAHLTPPLPRPRAPSPLYLPGL